MIIAIGQDLIEVDRIRSILSRFGEHFLRRVYTKDEIAWARQHADPAIQLAARFAAKEAVAKALGTGISQGLTWQEIETIRLPDQPPRVSLHGFAAKRAALLGITHWHLSLTHTHNMAGATVLAECRD